MTSNEIRQRFLDFFAKSENGGHKILPSSSLVPEGDISVLFTTAGMQQFKPYYLAPDNAIKDFGIKNVVTVQKCVRTGDIEEVGDATHLSFFEMLGNFSFGGYGRREAITYAYDFITKEMGLKISYVTYYKGEGVVPADIESKNIWAELDSNLEIREDGADVFWGPTGLSGPCGPTTEIYCKNALGQDVEIWNIVFNEYFCDGSREQLDKGEANLKKLDILGIDTGMGLERLVTIKQQEKSVYDTDLFESLINEIKRISNKEYREREARIIADHLRTAVFMIADGVIPSNSDRGYVLRRLLRRTIRHADSLGFVQGITSSNSQLSSLITLVFNKYVGTDYSFSLGTKSNLIFSEIEKEEKKFRETLANGLKEFDRLEKNKFWNINGIEGEKMMIVFGEDAFNLFQTYGFPIELTIELATERGMKVDTHTFDIIMDSFNTKMAEHQKLSQTASAGMFKGGLANHNEKTIQLHTAHHLLLAALQQILGKGVKQRGSNITEERLRIDFIFDRKMTDEEKKQVEDIVNQKISQGLNVIRREMPLVEAEKLGAEMEFGAKYPEMVSLYMIEDKDGNHFSKEFCGGPHVSNTNELGHFKIQKEEAVSQGVRRIKAILE